MGTVYFFRETGRKEVKVGYSDNGYKDRFASFSMYSSSEPYVVGIIFTSEPLRLEKKIHKDLNKYHVRGEFYEITDDKVNEIVSKYDKPISHVSEEIRKICEKYNVGTNAVLESIDKALHLMSIDLQLYKSNDLEILVIKSINQLLDSNNLHEAKTDYKTLSNILNLDISKRELNEILKKYYKKNNVMYNVCTFTNEKKTCRPYTLKKIYPSELTPL
jgi:hypothetical protein